MIEGPGAAPIAKAAALEDFTEQALAGTSPQEHILARRVLVAEARRYGDAFDTQLHRIIEELRHLIRVLAAEQRAVDRDAKALRARQADGGHRLLVDAFQAYRLIVALLIAIQVDRKCQV